MESIMKLVAVALLVLSELAQGNREPCTYKAVGDSMTISLQRSRDCVEGSLTWKFNSVDIFRRKRIGEIFSGHFKVSLGKPSDVTANGSLQLTNLQMDNSGEYRGDLHDSEGRLCTQEKVNLCMIAERVSKPSVTYTCSKDAVTLTCDSQKSKIKWSQDGLNMEGEFQKTLIVPGRPGHNAHYSCIAWNEVGEEKSDDLTIRCLGLLSLKVMSQNQGVSAGGDVSILCNSTPPADQYILWTPRSNNPLSLTAEGEFKLKKAMKEDGGLYTCLPQWTPPHLYEDVNITVQLHVFPQEGTRPTHGGVTPQVNFGTNNTLPLATYSCLFLCLSVLIV